MSPCSERVGPVGRIACDARFSGRTQAQAEYDLLAIRVEEIALGQSVPNGKSVPVPVRSIQCADPRYAVAFGDRSEHPDCGTGWGLKFRAENRAQRRSPLIGPSRLYFTILAAFSADGAIENTNHVFQPDDLFCSANSQ
jgi:hypothetical protein